MHMLWAAGKDKYLCKICRSQLEDRATVLRSLATVQSTLTHLKVMMGEWDWDELPAYSIGDLLETFPHLISFSCCNIDSHFDAAPTTCPSLKELKLAHFQYEFDQDDIDDLTSRLPSLEILGLQPCADIAALSLIQDNCPKLKVIFYNHCGHRPIYMQRITYKGINNREPISGDDNDDGLQLLEIDQGPEEHLLEAHISEVITSITRNSDSLQLLRLRYHSEADITDHHSLYADVTFNHMTSYTHDIFNDEDMILAMDLIRRSPQLMIIELHKGYPEYADDNDSTRSIPSSHRCDDLSQLFTIMSGLPHLEVADVQVKGDNATTGVEQFLLYHGSIDSKLRQLYVPKSVHFSIKTLDCVTRVSRLEHLTMKPIFQECADCWFGEVRKFLEKLAERCRLLYSLKLYDIHPHHLQCLTRFPNLKSLSLKMSLTDVSDLLRLMQSPKLEHLDVDSRSTLGTIHEEGEVANTLKNRFDDIRIC